MSPSAASQLLAGLQYADSQFPGGAFAFSWGLEGLVADKIIMRGTFETFLRDQIRNRWLSFDRYFVEAGAAFCRDIEKLAELDDLIDAWTPVESQRTGSCRAGSALLGVHARLGLDEAVRYRSHARATQRPCHVALMTGLVLGAHGIDVSMAAAIAVHSVMVGSVTAAIRLGLVSHVDGQRAIGNLRCEIAEALSRPGPGADELCTFTPLSEIAMMRHPHRELRLFSN